jgi:hypothetical protein
MNLIGKKITKFLETADLSIDDVEVYENKFKPEDLPSDIPEGIRNEVLDRLTGSLILEAKTVHITPSGKRILLELEDESDGTQKIFALAGPVIDTLENGYVLVIDELNDNLHPLIVRYLVGLFNDPKTNKNNAQLVFTTHDSSLLDQEIFRRDQIWFCEKTKEQSSEIYPLTDFNPRKKAENLEKRYLSGRYGALPFISNFCAG